MPEIELKPVKSSNIEAVGYDEETEELRIEFKGGGIYAYDSVPQFEYRDLLDAKSIGGHFHKKIKDKFPTRKLK
jgi:hypothetical protein